VALEYKPVLAGLEKVSAMPGQGLVCGSVAPTEWPMKATIIDRKNYDANS